MPKKRVKAQLRLSEMERQELLKLSQSRTAPVREVQRATILLKYADGQLISSIQKQLNISRPSIYKCLSKALAAGVETALKDKYHRSREPSITAEAKLWVVNLACTKPTDHGYAAEMWTLSNLAKHARKCGPPMSWAGSQGNDLSNSQVSIPPAP
jgi:transposase